MHIDRVIKVCLLSFFPFAVLDLQKATKKDTVLMSQHGSKHLQGEENWKNPKRQRKQNQTLRDREKKTYHLQC
jgi:hypothetical protein